MDWNKQRCLLTGASGGIGQAIAQALAEKGVTLILQGRNQARLEQLRERLPGNHYVLCADLGDHSERQELARKVSVMGGISMLINNAGISHLSLLEDTEAQEIDKVINTNLIAPIMLTQALLPALKQSQDTYIVNIGSAFGSIGFAGQSAYCASKFGMRGFTESLYRELADTKIHVSYLAPRATATQINSDVAVAMNQKLGNSIDPPEKVAQRLITQLEGRKARAFIGFPERLFVKINGLFPSIVDKALIKKLQIIKSFIAQPMQEKK